MVGYQKALADNIPAREASGIQDFGGMVPIKDRALLPAGAAQYCENAYLYNGTVRGFGHANPVYACKKATTRAVYRIALTDDAKPDFVNSLWLEFDDPHMSVCRAPMVEDSHQRYYFFPSTGTPYYNTLANLKAGSPGWVLGLNAPSVAPTVSASGGTSTVTEVRAYLYTWSTQFGEEGPPSPPAVDTGTTDGVWSVGITHPTGDDLNQTCITTVNIYRTVTASNGSAAYYRVASFPIGRRSYEDAIPDATVAANLLLPSSTWTKPPSDLQGVVVMANGMLVGFSKSYELWFCEPYTPWAWPAAFSNNVDAVIVGLAAVDSSLIVLTEGQPWIATGVTPATITQSKIPTREPCVSRGSIVSTAMGAFYASPNGLVLVNSGGATNTTLQLMSKENWTGTNPYTLTAAMYENAYVAFNIASPARVNGFITDNSVPNVTFSWLAFGQQVDNVYWDVPSGAVFVLAGGHVHEWNPSVVTGDGPYVWHSKEFRLPFAQDYVGAKIYFDVPPTLTIPAPTPDKRNTSQTQTFDPTKQYLLLKLFADGREVVRREVQQSEEIILFPSGFKATYWSVRFEGQVTIRMFGMATSVKELQLL